MIQFGRSPRHPANGGSNRGGGLRVALLLVSLAIVASMMTQLRRPEAAKAIERAFASLEAPSEPPTNEELAAAEAGLPAIAVDQERMSAVTDNSAFREAETEAWFICFEELQNATVAELAESPTMPATYAQLVSQPNVYRGQLVSIRGDILRAEQVAPAENPLGIEELFRLTVRPEGGQNWPITLYSLSLPNGLQLGDTQPLPVAARGIFFKNLSYRWAEGLGLTPVLLVKRVELPINPPPDQQSKPVSALTPGQVVAIAGAVALVAIGLLARSWRNEASPGTRPKPSEPDFAQLSMESEGRES